MDAQALLRDLAEGAQAAHPDVDDRPRLAALQRLPAHPARTEALPADLPEPLPGRLALAGVDALYAHQARVREHALAGRDVVVATGTASGKTLAYQLPLVERLLADPQATALYLAPTKALARDQLRSLRQLRLPQVRAAAIDGDTPRRERDAIRASANVVLTNPDLVHASLLGGHRRWGDFWHRLAVVVIDELHVARGVFGAHVAAVLRRLRRVLARYDADPVFVGASATIANPAQHLQALTGRPAAAVTEDASPRPPVTLAVWDPPLEDAPAGRRRSPLAESAALLAGLVKAGPATLDFVKSRKGAEVVARAARGRLDAGLAEAVAAYRAGHRPEERRAVEQGLLDGSLRGVATTDALELGVDVGALDAVVLTGWPGTAASFWQQAGRAGRRGQEAVVVYVADDDPLDRYLLAHPQQLWHRPLEAATAEVTNPYVLAPHLRCAAWEAPLADDEPTFHPADVAAAIDAEVAAGRLRRRDGRAYVTARTPPARQVGLRGAGGEPITIVSAATGEVIGDVDAARALRTVHPGAVYLHQHGTYRVRELALDDRVATVEPLDGDEATSARTDTDIAVLAEHESVAWGRARMALGRVQVTSRVLGYQRTKVSTGESLGVVELDLPPQELVTVALWLSVPGEVLDDAGLAAPDVAGSAHAAEHAAIALLPLLAMCDRWDIGGVSTPWHPDTGEASVFVYDGHPGGVGIAEQGFRSGARHLSATLAALQACPCEAGCPSCVQSPKCGNGNEPLDKAGAIRLLAALLAERAADGA